MIIKAYVCISDCGDGSTTTYYYRTMEEAEAKAERDLQYGPMGQAEELQFTVVDGVLCPLSGFDEVED